MSIEIVANKVVIQVIEDSKKVVEVVGVGLQGPPGPGLTSLTYNQTLLSNSWNVNHNLGYRPSVTCYTDGGLLIEGSVLHSSLNRLTIDFNLPQSGTARLV
jgi:hypothetical protein